MNKTVNLKMGRNISKQKVLTLPKIKQNIRKLSGAEHSPQKRFSSGKNIGTTDSPLASLKRSQGSGKPRFQATSSKELMKQLSRLSAKRYQRRRNIDFTKESVWNQTPQAKSTKTVLLARRKLPKRQISNLTAISTKVFGKRFGTLHTSGMMFNDNNQRSIRFL